MKENFELIADNYYKKGDEIVEIKTVDTSTILEELNQQKTILESDINSIQNSINDGIRRRDDNQAELDIINKKIEVMKPLADK